MLHVFVIVLQEPLLLVLSCCFAFQVRRSKPTLHLRLQGCAPGLGLLKILLNRIL